jgi:hypothetical protein
MNSKLIWLNLCDKNVMATSSSSKFYVAKKSDNEKSVWFYFNRDKSGNLAKCKKCDRELMTNGGSTKGLHCSPSE